MPLVQVTLGTRFDRYGQASGFAVTFDGTNANGLYGASISDYVGFSITANSPFTLDNLEFELAQGGASGPRGFTVTYNLNGGPFSVIGVAALNVGVAGAFAHYSIDFGNAAITASDTVEVRLLGFSTGSGNSIRFDNVAVTAIPEIASFTLPAGVFVGLFLMRRRRN